MKSFCSVCSSFRRVCMCNAYLYFALFLFTLRFIARFNLQFSPHFLHYTRFFFSLSIRRNNVCTHAKCIFLYRRETNLVIFRFSLSLSLVFSRIIQTSEVEEEEEENFVDFPCLFVISYHYYSYYLSIITCSEYFGNETQKKKMRERIIEINNNKKM